MPVSNADKAPSDVLTTPSTPSSKAGVGPKAPPETVGIAIGGKVHEFPVVIGSEGERGIQFGKFRDTTGYIALDPGYGNIGSCVSSITFIDGEKGILRYRGIPIEQLAEKSSFVEAAYLLIHGKLPNRSELEEFSQLLTDNAGLDETMRGHFCAFPRTAHPMAILSSMITASSCFYPELLNPNKLEDFGIAAARLISQVRTIAAFSYRVSRGIPPEYPHPDFKYTENLLHMMFSKPYAPYDRKPEVVRALDLIFLLHADHEQNCSTSTVRMVGSSGASLYAAASAGVNALSGPLHGGANQAVLEMLESIYKSGDDGTRFIEQAKSGTGASRLMGFGHRVYKNYDPRARIIGKCCEDLLKALNKKDPLLDIARRLEEKALGDSYFRDRKLYPNVDFYSGIMMRAIGIPTDMFTVMFSIGRMPGWIAHFKEGLETSKSICRPRQIYTGSTARDYVPLDERE